MHYLPNKLEGRTTKSAFVCLKSPDLAASARASLHNSLLDNIKLIITHYELKENREFEIFERKDKADFIKFKYQEDSQSSNSSMANVGQMFNQPGMINMITLLL